MHRPHPFVLVDPLPYDAEEGFATSA
jgi:hypothetical protein